MSKQITIRIHEPQPLPCPNCKECEGYQYFDLYRMGYTSFHKSDGKYEGGQYNDGTVVNKGKTVYCCNCGTKLPFKLKREGHENVEPNNV